ncbi:putative trans-sialidase [Trypanosoma theileri]|uniref:Putative trans-sialidase n=1 Tax=Trypanosoma theileri TaxID=67003 RepID=A0A1X0NUJ1_9TRYP|nr:putative trans-sialidase [Trypanosoma theileri]ORC88153.1 putative trans-sialidase [Trypanosoma theileri]
MCIPLHCLFFLSLFLNLLLFIKTVQSSGPLVAHHMIKSRARNDSWWCAKDRSAFRVAPPQRYVINRSNPAIIPHNLSVIVVMDPNMIEPTAFLQPIAPLSADDGSGENGTISTSELAQQSSPSGDLNIPSFFKLHVYVWDDTTLREILEEVLALSAAARRVLMPHPPVVLTTTRTVEEVGVKEDGNDYMGKKAFLSESHEQGKNAGKDGVENNQVDIDVEKNDGSVASGIDDDSNSVKSEENEKAEPPFKRDRTEMEDEKEAQQNVSSEVRRMRGRNSHPGAPPVTKVRVSHVFVDNNKRPQIRGVTVLRVDKPIFHAGDYITMQELRISRGGARGWKNGDLLVLSPLVRYQKSTSI